LLGHGYAAIAGVSHRWFIFVPVSLMAGALTAILLAATHDWMERTRYRDRRGAYRASWAALGALVLLIFPVVPYQASRFFPEDFTGMWPYAGYWLDLICLVMLIARSLSGLPIPPVYPADRQHT